MKFLELLDSLDIFVNDYLIFVVILIQFLEGLCRSLADIYIYNVNTCAWFVII